MLPPEDPVSSPPTFRNGKNQREGHAPRNLTLKLNILGACVRKGKNTTEMRAAKTEQEGRRLGEGRRDDCLSHRLDSKNFVPPDLAFRVKYPRG